MRITKRDVKVFLLGMLTMFLFLSLYDWQNNLSEIQKGFDAGYSDSKIKK